MVDDDTLAENVEAVGEAASGAGDGGAELGALDVVDDSVVKVDGTKAILDAAAAEGEGLGTGEVPLDAVLEDLVVGGLVELLCLAEHAGPGLADAHNLEVEFVLLGHLGPVADADVVLVHGVKHGTLGGVGSGVRHFLLV